MHPATAPTQVPPKIDWLRALLIELPIAAVFVGVPGYCLLVLLAMLAGG